MKIVGLTGGIGSGKTTVAEMFSAMGIPVYNSDIEAKKLTNSSEIIRQKLVSLLGEETYIDGVLNRKFMADKIFNSKELLLQVNSVIHPKVAEHFKNWVAKQNSIYVLKEAAILYESGGDAECDLIILVTAPKEVRLQRVMDRDLVSRKEVEARMKNQWSDTKKAKLADFVIDNTNFSETKKQVESIHYALI